MQEVFVNELGRQWFRGMNRGWVDRVVGGGHSKRRNSRAESWEAEERWGGSLDEPMCMTNRER